MPSAFNPIIRIAKFAISDEIRQKSFIIMFLLCALFVFLVRGCFGGNYMVNGQMLDPGTIVMMISKIAFHVIAVAAMVICGLLAMRVFRRDQADGVQSCILSKPINRWQYVTGKILGLWILSALFMFILHGIIFAITSISLRVIMPEYLIASFVCSLNLLFIVFAVFLLSLLMPDILAFLSVLGIGIGSFVADGIYAVSHSQMVQEMAQQQGTNPDLGVTGWRITHILWPKLSATERLASSLIGTETIFRLDAVYPFINISLYCLVLGLLLILRFKKEDIV
ncbi:MAG: ABC transporter permease [Syntrophales bacterium]|nr:ABC transporter permease [Syntrophales bacterium]